MKWNVNIKNGYKMALVLLLVITAGFYQQFFAAAQATSLQEFESLIQVFEEDAILKSLLQGKKRLQRIQEIIEKNPEVARAYFLEGWVNLDTPANGMKDRGERRGKMLIQYGNDMISRCNVISALIQGLESKESAAAQEEGIGVDSNIGVSESIVKVDSAIGVHPIIGTPLYISRNILFDKQGEFVDVKELFNKYQIEQTRFPKERLAKKSVEDQRQYWLHLANIFKSRVDTQEPRQSYEVTPADAPLLVEAARNTLKSLLLTDDKQLPLLLNKENYIQKTGLERILAYASIKQDIERKPLPHVHVPKKVLVIQRHKTGEYVSSKDAPAIIDDIIKAFFKETDDGINVSIYSDFYNHDYKFTIFAEKIQNHPWQPLSKEAFAELQELCKDCPFDVGDPMGGNNIFTDINGDAWIIDTEFKGEPSSVCIDKLNRYR